MVELVGVPSPAAVDHAYAAVVGDLVLTAGACPLGANGAVVAVGDVAGQTRQVVDNLTTALEAAGVLGVTVLGYPDQLVEVEAIAVRAR